jgi:hypothetical protein
MQSELVSWTTHVDDSIVLIEDNAAAYIVRVWLEHREVEGAPTTWRGSIEHVASGKTKYLTDLDDIARFIQPFMGAMGVTFSKPTK